MLCLSDSFADSISFLDAVGVYDPLFRDVYSINFLSLEMVRLKPAPGTKQYRHLAYRAQPREALATI